MTHLVLPLHDDVVEPLQVVAESVDLAAESVAAESDVEPLHAAVDPTVGVASLTETSCLCVRI
jgi:hypothetical protein